MDMERGESDDNPRLDVDGLIEVYRWVNRYLPDEIGFQFDAYIGDGALAEQYPHDAAEVYRRLSDSADMSLRMLAAAGLGSLVHLDPDAVKYVRERLMRDGDEMVAEQMRRTLGELT